MDAEFGKKVRLKPGLQSPSYGEIGKLILPLKPAAGRGLSQLTRPIHRDIIQALSTQIAADKPMRACSF
jgi:hypothetical protein